MLRGILLTNVIGACLFAALVAFSEGTTTTWRANVGESKPTSQTPPKRIASADDAPTIAVPESTASSSRYERVEAALKRMMDDAELNAHPNQDMVNFFKQTLMETLGGRDDTVINSANIGTEQMDEILSLKNDLMRFILENDAPDEISSEPDKIKLYKDAVRITTLSSNFDKENMNEDDVIVKYYIQVCYTLALWSMFVSKVGIQPFTDLDVFTNLAEKIWDNNAK
jgi:hypothetical protein